jgi:hypothetical protein
MKRTILFILITLTSFLCQAQDLSLFSKIGQEKGVSYVCISKSMLTLFGPNLGSNKGNSKFKGGFSFSKINNISKNLDKIEIISTSTLSAAQKIRKIVQTFTPQNGYEEIMKIKDGSDNVIFYFKKGKPNNFFILVDDEKKKEINIIALSGNISLEDISKLTNRKK